LLQFRAVFGRQAGGKILLAGSRNRFKLGAMSPRYHLQWLVLTLCLTTGLRSPAEETRLRHVIPGKNEATATLRVFAAQPTGNRIPPFITGKFPAHLGQNIHHGMFAQILHNPTLAPFPFAAEGMNPDGAAIFKADRESIKESLRQYGARSGRAASAWAAGNRPELALQFTNHDVSAELQAALNAAPDGSTIKLPAGQWQLSKPVTPRGNVALEGTPGETILTLTATNHGNPVLLEFPVGTTNVRVETMIFDGGGQNFSNPHPLIAATAGTNIVFTAITVRNSRGMGLLLQGGMQHSGVRNSHFFNLGNHWKATLDKADRIQGLVFCCGEGNTDNFATGNAFEDIGLDALQIGDQVRFLAASNTFNLGNQQFELVIAPDYPAGIFILHSAEVVVTGNTIFSAAGNGIDAPGLQTAGLSNNVISGCGGCGIGLFLGYDGVRQTHGVAVIHNTITDNVRWSQSSFLGGITISGGTPGDIVISDNVVTDTHDRKTQTYGIQVRDQTIVTGLRIDHSNRLAGNRLGELNGADYETP
jgi:hypothetical protein